ncbi:MAG TPA: hypothetical protein VM425_10255 [Myxococcota bacterium]|nr:hypothetical protein [Myxococcota bacterium]
MGKFIGVLLLIVLGIPLLIGVIFASGLTRAATSPDFYGDLAGKVVKRMPEMIDKSFAAARQPGAVSDPDARAWIEAMAGAKTSFPKMLELTGIQGWLQDEVAVKVARVGELVAGKAQPGDITLDMRPLKKALVSDEMGAYLNQVLALLPVCNAAGIERWKQRAISHRHEKPLPACNPGAEVIDQRSQWMAAWLGQIPDQKPMFAGIATSEPVILDALRWIDSAMWLLFLLPALFIAIGALLLRSDGRGFLSVCGGTIFTGGIASLLLSWLASGWLIAAIGRNPDRWLTGADARLFGSQAGRLFIEELSGTVGVFLHDLFSPVMTSALVVCGIGLGMLVLSFLLKDRRPEKPISSMPRV